MKKIKLIRRQELIKATMGTIFHRGFADLTVAEIAKDAQVSTGNIHYYFGGKDALLEATMRYLLSLLGTAYQRRVAGVVDPVNRIHALVQANFDETFFSCETCRVWTQFWALAPYRPDLARLQRLNKARVRSNIISPLRKFNPPQDIEVTANVLQAYMDGVWTQAAQSSIELDLKVVQEEALSFTEHVLSNRYHSTPIR